jgi:ATP-dependent Lon protease
MRYVQGWLWGSTPTNGQLVPFELAVQPGRGLTSGSGTQCEDLLRHVTLCRWAVALLLEEMEEGASPFDCHINLALHYMTGSGPSCRLAIANAILDALRAPVRFRAERTLLTGDITLAGDVLPVGDLKTKLCLKVPPGDFSAFIIPESQECEEFNLVRVAHLRQLLHLGQS